MKMLPFIPSTGDPTPMFLRKGGQKFYPIGARLYRSVTTITDGTIPKYLVPWAEDQGKDAALTALERAVGLRIPHETLVEGVKHLMSETLQTSKTKHAAGDVGTNVHDWIQWRCGQLVPPKQAAKAPGILYDEPDLLTGFAARCVKEWKPWADERNLRPVMIEKVVWDDTIEVAGMLDFLSYADFGALEVDQLTLFDWKTSRGIYPEAKAQIGGYAGMVRPILARYGVTLDRAVIVRLPKKETDPPFNPAKDTYTMFPDEMEYHWRGFRALVGSWEYLNKQTAGKEIPQPKKPRSRRKEKAADAALERIES